MRALFLGDSHLANLEPQHLVRLENELAATIDNAAFGGAWSGDLLKQIGERDLEAFDVVLLSIGTNDAHPAYNSSPETLRRNLVPLLAGSPRTILLLSPGVHEAPAPFDTTQLNATIRAYSDIAAKAVTEHGGLVVRIMWVLDEIGSPAWASDGLHLSTESYDLLLPTLASALSARIH